MILRRNWITATVRALAPPASAYDVCKAQAALADIDVPILIHKALGLKVLNHLVLLLDT